MNIWIYDETFLFTFQIFERKFESIFNYYVWVIILSFHLEAKNINKQPPFLIHCYLTKLSTLCTATAKL